MADVIAGLSMSVSLTDKTTPKLESMKKSLDKVIDGVVGADKQFNKLSAALAKMFQNGEISSKAYKQSIQDLNAVFGAYAKVKKSMEAGIKLGIDMSDMRALEAEQKKLLAIMNGYMTQAGNVRKKAILGVYGQESYIDNKGKSALRDKKELDIWSKSVVSYTTSALNSISSIDAAKKKTDTAWERQKMQVDGYIRELKSLEQRYSSTSFNKGVDTTGLEKAKDEVVKLRSELEKLQQKLAKGVIDPATGKTTLVDPYALRYQRKNVIKGFEREFAGASRNNNYKLEEEKVRQKIDGIERKINELNNMKLSVGVSSSTKQEIGDVITKLQELKGYLELAKGSSTDLLNKHTMKSLYADMTIGMRDAKDVIAKAKQDQKDSATAQREAAQASKAKVAEEKKYLGILDSEGVKLEKLKRLRDALNAKINSVTSAGGSAKALGLGEALKQVQKEIDNTKRLMTSVSKQDIVSGKAFSTTPRTDMAKVESATRNVLQAARDFEKATKDSATAVAKKEKEIEKLINQYRRLEAASKGANNAVSSIKDALMQFAPVYGIQQILMSIIEIGGEIEKQHIAMQSILGDLQNANILFGDIKQLALQSPFTFGELNKDVKQLAAYGVEYEDLYDTTKRLADISSGLGVSFERIALAYGQVKSRSWLDGKELRQFAYAGIPLLQRLAEMYSKLEGQQVSTSQVRSRVTNREVSFEDVQRVLWDMTEEGGQFYNMQLTLSETLLGRYNKLKDAWEIMLSGFARGDSIVGGTMKKLLDFVTSILLNIKSLTPVFAAFIAYFAKSKFLSIRDALVSKGMTSQNAISLQNKAKELGIDKNITLEKTKQLIASRQLTIEEARQLGLLTKKQAGMARMTFLARGLSATFKGLYAAMGGWIGIGITAVISAVSYIYDHFQEISQKAEETSNELKDRIKQINDFQDAHIKVDVSDVEKAKDVLEDYVKFIKEKSHDMQQEAIRDIFSVKDLPTQIAKAKGWIDNMKASEELAEEKSSSFTSETKGYFDDLKNEADEFNKNVNLFVKHINELDNEGIQKIADALGEQAKAAVAGAETLKEKRSLVLGYVKQGGFSDDQIDNMPGLSGLYVNQINKQQKEIEETTEKLIDKIKDVYAGSLDDLKNDPVVRGSLLSLIESGVEGLDKDVALDVKFAIANKLFGTDNNKEGAIANEFFKELSSKLGNSMDEGVRVMAFKLKTGQELNDAENKKLKEISADVKKQLVREHADWASVLQGLLDRDDFKIRIGIEQSIDEQLNELQKEASNKAGKGLNIYQVNAINRYGKEGNALEAGKKATADVDTYKKQLAHARKMGYSTKIIEANLKTAQAGESLFGHVVDDKKGGGGSRIDIELKNLQKRVDAVKKLLALYKEYRKSFGKTVAIQKTNELAQKEGLGEFDFSDTVGVMKKLTAEAKALSAKKPKDEARKSYAQVRETEENQEGLKLEQEEIEATTKQWESLNSVLKTQYELREQIQKKYGKTLAQGIAGISKNYDIQGGKINLGASYETDLEDQLSVFLANAKDKSLRNASIDEVLTWDEKKLTDAFGNMVEAIKVVKALKEERERLQKTAKETVIAQLDSLSEHAKKLEEIDNELKDTLDKINRMDEDTPEKKNAKDRAREIAKSRASYNSLEHMSEYISLVKTPLAVTSKEAQTFAETLREQVEGAFKTGAISADEYSEKIKVIDEAMEKSEKGLEMMKAISGGANSTFQFFNNYFKQQAERSASKSGELRSQANAAILRGDTASAKALNAEANKALGDSKAFGKFAGMMQGAQSMVAVIDTIVHGINNFVQGLKGIADEIKELQEAFGDDSMQYSDGYGFLSTFATASSKATAGWDSLKNGDIGGALAGTVGSITSWFTGFAGHHDKKQERMITELQKNNDVLIQIRDNIKKEFEGYVGRMYSWKSSDSEQMLKETMKQMNAAYGVDITKWGELIIKKKYGQDLQIEKDKIYSLDYAPDSQALKYLRKATETGSYYDTQLAAIYAEKGNYEKMMDAENDKKKTDSNKIDEYKQKIYEAEEQIKDFARTMAEELYGINFDSIANNIASALTDAWATGADSVKAYKDAVSGTLKDIASSVLQQKFIGSFLDEHMDKFLESFNENSGIMGKYQWDMLDEMMQGLETQIEGYNIGMDAINEVAKKWGYDMKDNDKKGNLSSNIQGMSEETADLLASYINAIRADVSVQRMLMQSLAEDHIPSINTNITLSLAQLREMNLTLDAISYNTQDIRDIMNDVVLGNRTLSVKTKIA